MAKKPNGWWKNPQTIVSLLVGLGAIGSWVIGGFVSDAKQTAKIEKTEERVSEIKEVVSEHDKAIAEADKDQELIQRDLDYLKESMREQKVMQQQIFEAVKKR